MAAASLTPAATRRAAFRPDLEGLRGAAILLVVAYHVGVPGARGGFVGVDVFFALSGYLITGLLVAELDATGTVDLAGFYARRARRLLPAGLVVVAVTLVLAALLDAPREVDAAAGAGRAAALALSNVFFAARATDYFADVGAPNPLLHTWSLAVEEQFYVVWPLVVWLAARGRSAAGAADRGRLFVVCMGLCVASLALSWWHSNADRSAAFFGTTARAWELAAGAVVAAAPRSVIGRRVASGPRWLGAAAAWLGVVLVLGAAVAVGAHAVLPGPRALVPVAGTVLVVAAADAAGGPGGWLAARPLRWLGRHSYAWYLWHWPLLALGGAALPHATTTVRGGLALAALGLAAATRAWVEEPCRRARALVGRPRAVLALGAAAATVVAAGATGLARAAARASADPAQGAIGRAATDVERAYADGCSPEVGDATVRVCTYGARDAATAVVLFGDSHAAHWLPAFEALAPARGWRVLLVTKRACPAVDAAVDAGGGADARAERACAAWRLAALDSIRARRPALVVVSNSSQYVVGGPGDAAPAREDVASVAAAAWGDGLARTLRALEAGGAAALVLQDVPHADQNVPSCLRRAAWWGRAAARCDFARAGAVDRAAAAATRRAVARVPGARAVDLAAAVCPGARCPAVVGGVVRYRDARHLTARGAAQLAPALGAALGAAVGAPLGGARNR